MKLDDGQKHLLQLILQEAGVDSWTPVSPPVFPLLERLPQKLIELERVGDTGRGRVRLTAEGKESLMGWSWWIDSL